jgi:hypothetical protein
MYIFHAEGLSEYHSQCQLYIFQSRIDVTYYRCLLANLPFVTETQVMFGRAPGLHYTN